MQLRWRQVLSENTSNQRIFWKNPVDLDHLKKWKKHQCNTCISCRHFVTFMTIHRQKYQNRLLSYQIICLSWVKIHYCSFEPDFSNRIQLSNSLSVLRKTNFLLMWLSKLNASSKYTKLNIIHVKKHLSCPRTSIDPMNYNYAYDNRSSGLASTVIKIPSNP